MWIHSKEVMSSRAIRRTQLRPHSQCLLGALMWIWVKLGLKQPGGPSKEKSCRSTQTGCTNSSQTLDLPSHPPEQACKAWEAPWIVWMYTDHPTWDLLEPRIGRAIPNLTFEMGSLWPHEWWNRYTRNLYVWVRYSKPGTVSRTRIENLTVVSVFIASLPLTYWNKYNIFSLILRNVDVSRIFLCNFYKNLPHSRCFFHIWPN